MKDKIMKIWNGQDGQVMMLCHERVERQEKSSFVPRGPITLISEISEVADNTQDLVVLQVPGELINDALLRQILKITKPEGYFAICDVLTSHTDVEFALKIAGFVNVEFVEDLAIVAAKKPIYEIGSSAKLNLKRPAISTVWTLDADDDETIDPDNLLDDEDLKKPDPSSLRVCGTTGKRKACKDCSCGLADELEAESKGKTLVDIPNGQKSSCGSCYLGDAFRCATCPYLGMPAFKPGEKVQLAGNLLQDDI